jgi:CDP-glucose 4,6-dehydratase
VSTLVEQLLEHWPGRWQDQSDAQAPHEAGRLNLAWDKAFHQLDWQPRWDFAETIHRTVTWYRQQTTGQSPLTLTQTDINTYNSTRPKPKT